MNRRPEQSAGRLERRRRIALHLGRRHRREWRFRIAGIAAVGAALLFLALILLNLFREGASAFTQSKLALPVAYESAMSAADTDYDALVLGALAELLNVEPDRAQRRELRRLLSIDAAFIVRERFAGQPESGSRELVTVPASANVDMLVKGQIDRSMPASRRPLSDQQIAWVDTLVESGALKRQFNTALFSNGDSREPELAGIRSAVMGSFYMLLVTLTLAFPIGVATAVYLEEFAPRNRWADIVEISINNLAAVPSIVFGLLGLAVFIDWFGFPRSAPLVGGCVLALLTLPVVIISSRAAIRGVPGSIREASLGLGASRMQVVMDHVLPLALPGVLTGTIIGMSRALGETAPLLMIGMVAFIVDVPAGLGDPATALPVQIYLWSDSPERAFAERTSAAILVLLGFLLVMNLLAVLIRRSVEKKY
ncbi:MAG: phosphate ABC transporter permease PstA [Pseudomonadota bacterium]